MRCRTRGIGIGVIVGPKHRAKGFWRGIMKVFCLLPYAILASITEATLDAPLARALVSCKYELVLA